MAKTENVGKQFSSSFIIVLLVLGLIWAKSSWGKLSAGEFVSKMPGTLGAFAKANPYPFVKSFLLGTAMQNATLFGSLTMWGELFTALAITIAAILVLFKGSLEKNVVLLLVAGLTVGAFLNAVFWLAAGHTSPSTDSVNLLMLGVEVVGVFYGFKLLTNSK